jgi:chromate reductase
MNAFAVDRHGQEDPPKSVRLLGLTGSLRRASYSTAILRGLQGEMPSGVSLDIVVPRLPLYDEDEDEAEALETVQAFRDKIGAADGLVICTPEYNHGMPGVLKNAIDWASRPSGKSVLTDKPTLVISNSPAFTGGVRAQANVHQALMSLATFIIPGKQVVIAGVREKIRDGVFIDKTNLSFALTEIDRLVGYCRRIRALQGC